MKKLIFTLLLAIGLMSFTSTNGDVKSLNSINSVQSENSLNEIDDWTCWARVCIVWEGTSYCTDWVETDCSEWENQN